MTNARATVDLREHGGLEEFVRSFAPDVSPAPEAAEAVATTSPESVALSKELKKRVSPSSGRPRCMP